MSIVIGLPIGIHAGSAYHNPPSSVGWGSYHIEDYVAQAQAFHPCQLVVVFRPRRGVAVGQVQPGDTHRMGADHGRLDIAGLLIGIVAVVLALLGVGAAFAVSAGMVPGLTLPALPF